MSETGSLAGPAARLGPALTRALAPASDAVELRLKSGDVRRIGTDDPQVASKRRRLARIKEPRSGGVFFLPMLESADHRLVRIADAKIKTPPSG